MFLISKYFKKSNKTKIDFTVLKTDIHSHLIPNIDDGCKSLDESVMLIGEMNLLGFSNIVCTPHVKSDVFKNNKEVILREFYNLQKESFKRLPNINLYVAAEYMLDDGFERLKEDELLFFGKNKYTLVELPTFSLNLNYKNILQNLLMAGYTPILAHPERYDYWSNEIEVFNDLKSLGVKLQANIASLIGFYGYNVQKLAYKLIKNNLISFLGSDIHNIHYLESIKSELTQKKIQNILSSNFFENSNVV